jgi:hypothetical protein
MAKTKKVVDGDPEVDAELIVLTESIIKLDKYTKLKGGSQEVLYDLACAAQRMSASANRASIWRGKQALWGHIGATSKTSEKMRDEIAALKNH